MLDELNAGQRAGAHLQGNGLILAPAGAGKTKTLQARIVVALADGVSARGILALTFTNKAAGELRERVDAVVGARRASQITASTFHAFCARTVRSYAHVVGRTAAFSVYDEDDALDIAKRVCVEMGEKAPARGDFSDVEKRLAKVGKLPTFRRLYQESLTRQNALDFDGLERAMRAVLDDPGCHSHFRQWELIVIDEYQDTSGIQAEIIDQMRRLAPRADVIRVGDPAQSIYAFRGARIENILQLAADPNVIRVRLLTNYRSGSEIVAAGNRVAKACGSPLDDVQAGRTAAGAVVHCDGATEEETASMIAQAVVARAERGVPPGRTMILARTWRELEPINSALSERGIASLIARKADSAWASQPMRHLVAAMRLGSNERDGVAFRRLVTWPSESVTSPEITRAEARAADYLDAFASVPRIAALALAMATEPANPLRFATVYATRAGLGDELGALGLESQRTDLGRALVALSNWANRRAETGEPATMRDLLSWYAFRHVLDCAENQHDPETGPVRLMTVHAAKGLEADHVHVVGVDRGHWPREAASADEAAEEVRAFYVAVTRARDTLHIHTSRARSGRWGGYREAGPSQLVRIIWP